MLLQCNMCMISLESLGKVQVAIMLVYRSMGFGRVMFRLLVNVAWFLKISKLMVFLSPSAAE